MRRQISTKTNSDIKITFIKKIYIHIYIEKELNDTSSHNDENQFSVAAFFFMRFSALPALNHSI